MAYGKRGDHPLTDILLHNIETYGPAADEAIRGVAEYSSKRELYEWWNDEINGSSDRELVLRKANQRLHELLQRSSYSGWGPQQNSSAE